MICFEEVSFAFGERVAVEQLSFKSPSRGVVGLLGANGAGKSTTIRLLTGIIAPHRGEILVAGESLHPGSKARRLIGYLPEDSPLPEAGEVAPYLEWVAQLKGLSASQAKAAVKEVVNDCDLGEVQRQEVKTLSRGFRQRLGLARALLCRPPILVLDEPLGGLDPIQLERMRQTIELLSETHLILISSHRLAEIERLAETLLVLSRGRLVASGRCTDLSASLGLQRLLLRGRGSAADVRTLLERWSLLTLTESEADEWCAELAEGEEQAPTIARSLIEAGLEIYELSPRERPLEELFTRLSGHEGSPS